MKRFDVGYLLLAAALVLADVLTESRVIEALAFLSVMIGFAFTVIPGRLQRKDERYQVVRAHSGYYAFMLTVITISLASMATRYGKLEIGLSEMLRYLVMVMYFIYSAAYAWVKRVI